MADRIADIVSEAQLRESYRKHATLAQLNRMWQYQERPESGLDNLLDMMAPDVIVRSPHLDVQGHDAMRAALAKIPMNWKAAHVLKSWKIAVDDGRTELRAKLDYLTSGAMASKAQASYFASFGATDTLLPRLARIDVEQGEGQPGATFVDMFAEHRILSTVHYFLALVENPAREAEPFFELLGEEFRLDYTFDPIATPNAFREWVAGPLSSVIASEHDIHSVACRDGGDGTYTAEVAMKSQAMFPDKSGAISRNTQSWTLTDAIGERFPRITEILIDRDSVVRFDTEGLQTG